MYLFPSNFPVNSDEFRIASMYAQDKEIQAVDSFIWPHTEQEKQERVGRMFFAPKQFSSALCSRNQVQENAKTSAS